MSGTAYNWHKWLGNPLPFYDDPATQQATQAGPGGGLGAPKQDTGWSSRPNPFPLADVPTAASAGDQWSAPSTRVPYTAPSAMGAPGGAGRFGYDYSGAAPGYNAWALFDDGTQDGGWYDAAADTRQWDSGRGDGTTETSRRRVWRWTLDDLKAQGLDPGKASIDVVNRAFLANVARLHRDFDRMGADWRQSGFKNFDRVLPAGTGGAGGNPMDPSNGTGLPIPGGSPTTTPVPMGPLNSIGGEKLANEPELAWRYLVQQMGGDPDYEGPFSGYMKQNFAPALAAMIQARLAQTGRVPGATGAAGQAGMDQIGNFMGEFGGMLGGNDLFTKLGGIGAQGLAAGGGLLNTASSRDAGNFVRQMLGLTGMGNGALGQSAQQYLTNKMMNDYTMSSINSRTGESPLGKFGSYLGNSGFLDKLRQFGLLQ